MKEVYQQLIDQPLHLIWAFGALAVFEYTPVPILDGVLAALVLAAPREFVDQWPINRWWDTLLDLSFFLIGGGLAGLMKWFV